MAIGSGSINTGSGNEPYVHSNVDRFKGNASVSISGTIIASRATIDFSIQALESVRDSLKKQADDFLKGHSITEVNADILKAETTYAGIAANIIQNRNIILTTIKDKGYINKNELEETIISNLSKKSTRIANKIKTEILLQGEQIPTQKAAEIIARSMGNVNGKITNTGTKLSKVFDIPVDELEKEFNNTNFNKLTSSKGKILDIIKEQLTSMKLVHKNNTPLIKQFMAIFEKNFLERVDILNFFVEGYTPRDYLNDLEKTLEPILQEGFSDLRNATGGANEEILAAVYQADRTVTLELTATGNYMEDQINIFSDKLKAMRTHHDNKKQSQTDMLIKNKSGNVVRAQSKTSLTEYTFKNEEVTRILNHLQRSIDLYKLLNSLNEQGGLFNISNIDEICYVVANSLWFNTHASITGHREAEQHALISKGAHGMKGADILKVVVEELNMLLAQQIPSFMGISLETEKNKIIADAQASNIFYIENGNLVPTWVELNEIIDDIKAYRDGVERAKSIRFTLESKGVSWAYPYAPSFWKAKVGGDDKNKGYYNPEPGYEQGRAAISSLAIHGNFSAILKYTSYTVGKK